jgi:2-keto-4-pentenoate hydratase/2-oxohepta-3-ene-1,7-dioic acid hydratase in catechol pathway
LSLARLAGREFRPERVFCIGRNYAEHTRELGNELPGNPVVFMKPASCLVPEGRTIRRPGHGEDLQFEAEIVLLLDPTRRGDGWIDVAGLALGLDLTLRDVQRDLKAAGLPWELAKAFDDSAPLGSFTPLDEIGDPTAIEFRCAVNGVERQHGRVADMIFPVPRLLAALSRAWTLRSGDLVFTGTPAGVGSLRSKDRVELSGTGLSPCSWTVA